MLGNGKIIRLYFLLFAIGFTAGLSLFNATHHKPVNLSVQTETEVETVPPETIIEEPRKASSSALEQIRPDQAGAEVLLQAADILLAVESFDNDAFKNFSLSEKGEHKNIVPNTEVAFQLLELIPQLSDARSKWRLYNLLRIANLRLGRERRALNQATQMESWLLERVRNYDSRALNLEVLSALGVQSPDSVDYLLSELPSTADTKDAQHILNAIADGILWIPQEQFQKQKTNAALISRYLEHESAGVRAAAVSTLRHFRNEATVYADLMRALTDDSEQVRYKAGEVISNRNLQTEQIRKELLRVVRNKDRSPSERIQAANILGGFPLTPGEREVLIEFGAKEYDALWREIKSKDPWEGN